MTSFKINLITLAIVGTLSVSVAQATDYSGSTIINGITVNGQETVNVTDGSSVTNTNNNPAIVFTGEDSDLTIDNSTVSSNVPTNAISTDENDSTINIQNGAIINGTIQLEGKNNNITVKNGSYISNSTLYAIELRGDGQITVDSSTIDSSGYGIYAQSYNNDEIVNISVQNNSSITSKSMFDGISANSLANSSVVIDDSTVSSIDASALRMTSSDANTVKIQNNATMQSDSGAAVFIDGTNNAVQITNGSDVTGAFGVFLGGGTNNSLVVDAASIKGTQDYGIALMNDSNASVYVQNGATVSGDTGILLEENSASILNILGNGTVVSGITGIDSDGSTQINVDAGAAVTGIGNAIDLSGDSNTVNITNGATVTGDTAIMLEGGSTSAALNVSDSILNGTTNALDIASTDAATVGFTGSQVYGAINTSSATAQTINMNGSAWTGNATTADGAGGMTLALSNGTDWFGDVTNSATGGDVNVDLSSSSWKGAAAGNGSTAVNINLADASAWTNTSDSTVSDINMSGSSTLIMDGGNITTTTLEGGAASDTVSALAATTAEPVNIYSTYNAATGQAYILNAGTATGTFNAGVTSGTSGAAGDMTGNTIVHVTDASGATFNEMESDVGVYRYTSETVANADGSTSVVLTNPDDDNGGGDNGGGDNGGGDNGGGDNGGGDDPTPPPAPTPDNHTLSTAAQSVVNTRAAAVNLWRDEEEALNLRMDNERRTGSSSHPGNRGAWGSYYGGYHRQQMNEASTSYDQTNNGFMVGADNRFDVRNGNVLIGFAAMRGNGDVNMHDMGSAGTDIDSYGLSLYTSYRLNNGLFFDATIKGEHLKNDMDVVSTDGGRSQGHYSNSGYGGSLKAGYHWQATPAFWAEPYARVSYIRYNGVDYTLDNGMRAKDDNYSSVLVEGGANIGTSLTIHNAEVKPYLHLAVADETENGNSMDINGVNVNDSTDGAKGIVGLGADVKFTKNLGAYAGANYAKGNDNEDPWQLNAGVTWTW